MATIFPQRGFDMNTTLTSTRTTPAIRRAPAPTATGLIVGSTFRGIEFYLPLLHGDATSLLDYFPREALIVLDDADELADTWSELEEQAIDLRHGAEDAQALPPNFPLPYVTWDDWHEKITRRSVMSLGEEFHPDQSPAEQLPFSPGPRFGGQLKSFIERSRGCSA